MCEEATEVNESGCGGVPRFCVMREGLANVMHGMRALDGVEQGGPEHWRAVPRDDDL